MYSLVVWDREMTRFEDHFSQLADKYASYRPQYPDALFVYLASLSPGQGLAWDCGTGNGQAARGLARYFQRVVATDASSDQIAQAAAHERIDYRVERAEAVSFEAGSVDLVTVAMAVHWFDLESFYQVVRRVGKTDGILAVWMYHLPLIDPAIDQLLKHYYAHVLAGYWPERIHFIEERYRTLPFPFEEYQPPEFEMQVNWDLAQVAGFLDSWSATRRYQQERGRHPVGIIWPALSDMWGEPSQRMAIRWPLYLRIGLIR